MGEEEEGIKRKRKKKKGYFIENLISVDLNVSAYTHLQFAVRSPSGSPHPPPFPPSILCFPFSLPLTMFLYISPHFCVSLSHIFSCAAKHYVAPPHLNPSNLSPLLCPTHPTLFPTLPPIFISLPQVPWLLPSPCERKTTLVQGSVITEPLLSITSITMWLNIPGPGKFPSPLLI